MTTHVVASDAETNESETLTITDNYVLVRDGSAYIASTTLHHLNPAALIDTAGHIVFEVVHAGVSGEMHGT